MGFLIRRLLKFPINFADKTTSLRERHMFFLFPYAIGRYRKRLPIITYGLIFFNVVIYFSSVLGDFESTVRLLGFKPDQNAWYTWFTHAFVHANPIHLGTNMVFLYAFGSFLEDILGEIKFITVYILGAFASAFIFGTINLIFIPQAVTVPLIGASGAISALLGLAMIRFRRNDLHIFYFVWLIFIKWGTFAVKTYVAVMIYFILQLLNGLMQITAGVAGGVGYWAHIGGFLFGVASVSFLKLKAEAVMEEKEEQAATWLKVGNTVAAASQFAELIEDRPDKAEYYHMAGKAHLDRNDKEAARKNYIQAIELYLRVNDSAAASQAYEELLRYRSDIKLPPQIQFSVSSACQSSGKFMLAVEGFEHFLRAYPNDRRAELALFRIGQVYEKMGEIDKAVAIFQDFLDRYPLSEWTSWAQQWLNRHNQPTKTTA